MRRGCWRARSDGAGFPAAYARGDSFYSGSELIFVPVPSLTRKAGGEYNYNSGKAVPAQKKSCGEGFGGAWDKEKSVTANGRASAVLPERTCLNE